MIGQACLRFDALRWTKPWGHFRLMGAGLISHLTARLAGRRRNLSRLGYALHMAQDAIGHGWVAPFMHKPELDDWSTASDAIKQEIRDVSARMLTAYQFRS